MTFRSEKGVVLILCLWVLGLLTVLSVQLNIQIRRKIDFVGRIEERGELRAAAASGVRFARAVILADNKKIKEEQAGRFLGSNKAYRFSNPALFQKIPLGRVVVTVRHDQYDWGVDTPIEQYGVSDENGRLNLNTATREELKRLIEHVLDMKDREAGRLAASLYDWRVVGESELEGFTSEDDYSRLKYGYEEKDAPYEALDELRMVKGVTGQIADRLMDFVTIYGDGRVNVNTASRPVLLALGLEEGTVEKILTFRHGFDGREATEDDFVFPDPSSIVPRLNQFTPLNKEEREKLSDLIGRGRLGTESQYCRIESRSRKAVRGATCRVTAIIESREARVVYWREIFETVP